jgi:ABC-type glutathione transport system ATPase component
MVTHRLAEARQTSDQTVMLEAGRVVEAGAMARLFKRLRTPGRGRTCSGRRGGWDGTRAEMGW